MSTTTTPKVRPCHGCGTPVRLQKSGRTGRWYPAERYYVRGYTGKSFTRWTPHTCLSTQPVSPAPSIVYGRPEGPVEAPESHEHTWLPWRQAKGSTVSGVWCQGCRGLLVN